MTATGIEILEDRTSKTPSDVGFLTVRRLRVRTLYNDGTTSEPYAYDVVDRRALDAVVILLYAARPSHPRDPYVCVRTALRPPLALRRLRELPLPDAQPCVELWELPAGLIEPHERGHEGVRACASRETLEETGLTVAPEAFGALGAATYLSPGMCGEKIHFVCARVDDPHTAVSAEGDGVLEARARIEWWPLSVCLARADEAVIEDAKTELALHRFVRIAGGAP